MPVGGEKKKQNKTKTYDLKRKSGDMFRNFAVILITASFGCFLYGVRHIFLEVEDNACRMTYMFEQPQFSRVTFKENEQFPNYGLYYYYEGGGYVKDVNVLGLKGAPVLFVPGNGGSYKQVRSLASVALRKGLDNDRHIHLNYFTIDFDEELSGLYGGYLGNQKRFVKYCVKAVLKLYRNSTKSVVIIGHSMGGKVAEAILSDSDIANHINTIVFISTPLDTPVVNFDLEINAFYESANKFLSTRRISYEPRNSTNTCKNVQHKIPIQEHIGSESSVLENVLLISIGGGNRDLLVRSGLTSSKYSDIHAMTSSIPNVWLSCDHLSSVWCLQLVLVINRFLFDISTTEKDRNVFFHEDKTLRVRAAAHYFVRQQSRIGREFPSVEKEREKSSYHEDSKLVLRKQFKNGLWKTYNQIIPLHRHQKYEKLYVELESYDEVDFIHGCILKSGKNSTCEKQLSLGHLVQTIPSSGTLLRSVAIIDISNVLKFYPNWTHVLLSVPPTNKPVSFNINVYNTKDRVVHVKSPRWFSLNQKTLINQTLHGTSHYKVLVEGLEEPFPTLKFQIEPIACMDKHFRVTTKICVPWARGFERFKVLTDRSVDKAVYVNVPFASPSAYNTSVNPVILELFLDPSCRFKVSYEYSLAGTASRIVQEFYHWLPAHVTAVLLLVLRMQIGKVPAQETFKFLKPYVCFLQYKSLFLVMGCRLFRKLLMPLKFLSEVELLNNTVFVSVIVHSTAVVLSVLAAVLVWIVLIFHGNFLHTIALRLTRMSALSSLVAVKVMTMMPVAFGILFVSIAFASCSGLALILASVFYFLMLSNAYKDYLENWAWEAAIDLLRKVNKKRTATESVSASDEGHNAESVSAPSQDGDRTREEGALCEGLHNFSFHITVLLLLLMTTFLNFGPTLAWTKSHYYRQKHEVLPDSFLISSIVVLSCLSVLLQLKAPQRICGYRVVSAVLYVCSCICVLYCQEAVYRLNFVIAFVFVVITLQEIVHRLRAIFS